MGGVESFLVGVVMGLENVMEDGEEKILVKEREGMEISAGGVENVEEKLGLLGGNVVVGTIGEACGREGSSVNR